MFEISAQLLELFSIATSVGLRFNLKKQQQRKIEKTIILQPGCRGQNSIIKTSGWFGSGQDVMATRNFNFSGMCHVMYRKPKTFPHVMTRVGSFGVVTGYWYFPWYIRSCQVKRFVVFGFPASNRILRICEGIPRQVIV